MPYIKATGPNLYIRPISINEIDAVRECVADWRADGVTLPENQAKADILNWIQQMKWLNEKTPYLKRKDESGNYLLDIPDSGVWESEGVEGLDTDISEAETRIMWAEGIFLRSNDTCVGVTKGAFSHRKYFHSMTALHPSYRGQGIWEEADKIGLKTLFVALPNVESITTWVPVERKNTTGAILASDAVESSDSQITLADRIDEVTYDKRVVTREQFLAWYNLSEQENLRNLYHKLEVVEEDLF